MTDSHDNQPADGADLKTAEVVRVRPDDAPAQPAGSPNRVDTLLRCLIRLTLHYGKPVAAPDIRATVPVPDAGMHPETFTRAAIRLGYAVREVPFDVTAAGELPVPFVLIGRKGGPSTLVLSRQGDELIIFDPLAEQTVRVKAGGAVNL